MKRQKKVSPVFGLKIADEEQGIVECVFTVFGVLDYGQDISHPGSFSKTIQERGDQVLVLNAHKNDSVLDVIGKPLEIKEVGRGGLPKSVLDRYPDATGGVWARTKFLIDTPEGKGAFERIKSGALHEWSYGYDIVEHDFSTVETKSGQQIRVRNLRSVKLYEYSPVLWGMNPATVTTAIKGNVVAEMGGAWRVYDTDEQGEPTGEAIGIYETKALAEDSLEKDSLQDRLERAAEVLAERKEMTMRGPVKRVGDVLQGTIHQTYTNLCDGLYIDGYIDREGRIKLSGAIGRALDVLTSDIPGYIADMEYPSPSVVTDPFFFMSASEPDETKAGRVLSGRNASKISAAIISLIEVLEAAGIDLPGLGQEEDQTEDEKGNLAPKEGKPWDKFFEDDQWVIRKVNDEGEPTGDPVGVHDTEDEADAQLAALYANEKQIGPEETGNAILTPSDVELVEIELAEIELLEV